MRVRTDGETARPQLRMLFYGRATKVDHVMRTEVAVSHQGQERGRSSDSRIDSRVQCRMPPNVHFAQGASIDCHRCRVCRCHGRSRRPCGTGGRADAEDRVFVRFQMRNGCARGVGNTVNPLELLSEQDDTDGGPVRNRTFDLGTNSGSTAFWIANPLG